MSINDRTDSVWLAAIRRNWQRKRLTIATVALHDWEKPIRVGTSRSSSSINKNTTSSLKSARRRLPRTASGMAWKDISPIVIYFECALLFHNVLNLHILLFLWVITSESMKRLLVHASEKDEINAKKKLTSRQKNSILSLSIYKLKLSIYKLRLSLYIRSLRIENYIRKHDFLFANFMTISANVHWAT